MGLTFQQLQKYESGTNRVSSSRLYDLSRILGVSVAFFFDEMGTAVANQSPGTLQGRAPAAVELDHDPVSKREALELVRAYHGIANQKVKQRLASMIRALAEGNQ
jgi:transcriptional regulator with XRE-family HTH domain